jgi:glutamate-1-semialdehyde 2,1-aminomutase
MKLKQEASDKLFSRAKEIIPGGIFGHYKYAVREEGPKFFSKAKDAYFWDVDGNKYVDLICGWGPMILGYNNPIIDKAAQSQYSSGNTVSIASPVMIDLAETLVDMVDIADWALFGKNGGDSTQLAVMISREETGRKKVLKITGGYHGANGWMQDKGSAGTIDSDRAEVISIPWNSIEDFDSAISNFGDEIACFISSPYDHPTSKDSSLPNKGYWEHIQKVCNKKNILIIVDDVRTGFRINLAGSNKAFNFSPDLVCLGKAIANGYPISALVGKDSLRDAANKVYFSGTQFFNSAPMAASKATLEELKKQNAVECMNYHGELLKKGLISTAKDHGFDLRVTGVPAMPYFRIEHENKKLHSIWSDECLSRGIYLTSYHNHFLSMAHGEEEVNLIIKIASEAFDAVSKL